MSDDYEVGYGKPPVATQFQKGQSGNPKGRRRGSKNLATMIQEALNEKVVVTLNGRRKKVSKLEAGFIQQSNKAASGDLRAMKLMLELLLGAQLRAEAKEGGEPVSAETRHQHDALVLSALRDRLKGSTGGDDHG